MPADLQNEMHLRAPQQAADFMLDLVVLPVNGFELSQAIGALFRKPRSSQSAWSAHLIEDSISSLRPGQEKNWQRLAGRFPGVVLCRRCDRAISNGPRSRAGKNGHARVDGGSPLQ